MQGRIKQMINGKDQEIITINKTGNSILNNAKYSADNTDEWYTTYETIAEELSHYKNQFIDKVVLCNCDDPLGQLWAYCKLIDPEEAFLFSSAGLGSLNKLVQSFRREDLLDFGDGKKIKKMKIAKWDVAKDTVDLHSLIPKI